LALNARDAMPTGGLFSIDVRNLDRAAQPPSLPSSPRGFVAIVLRDTGTGMPADVAARAFEPFFTTKKPGSGTGLGLSQVFGFAEASGGLVDIDSEPERGTQISIIIPFTDKPLVTAATGIAEQRARPLAGRVLLVDDNVEVMTVIKTMIVAMGLDVESTENPSVALHRLASEPERFDLLLTDVVMPGMNGVDLVRQARASHVKLPVILMSGYNDVPTPGEFRTLRKPVSYDELYDAIQAALQVDLSATGQHQSV
jgi:CheY-like chemotaxis protein